MSQQLCTFRATITKQVALNYLLWLPKNFGRDITPRFPLIFFLHGVGESSDDVEKLKQQGLPKLLENPPDFLNPFVIISPQCRADSDWSLEMDALIALLDDVTTQYAIDPMRVYLTGLSMGGRGAWHLAALHPSYFAALVPICGARPDIFRRAEQIARLKNIPTWIFHGEQDTIVPVDESVKMFDALRNIYARVELTIYPDARHDSWTRTYANPKLYEWLLAQKGNP